MVLTHFPTFMCLPFLDVPSQATVTLTCPSRWTSLTVVHDDYVVLPLMQGNSQVILPQPGTLVRHILARRSEHLLVAFDLITMALADP